MAIEPTLAWTPEWAVPPGEILLEVLDERGITQSDLARRLDRPLKTINEIIKGKAAITPDTAIQLERTLGITARFWTNLETNYRESLARQRAEKELAVEATWARRFPVKELVRHGVLTAAASPAALVDGLLRYFAVSNRAAWERRWSNLAVSYRSSKAFPTKSEAVAAWLRWGEVIAATIDCDAFSADRLRASVPEIRKLTRVVPVNSALDRLRDLCATCGVAVAVIPKLSGAPISGAARWLAPDKALIQLSLRHERDDQLWFSMFHEIDHLLHPPRRRDFVDLLDDSAQADSDERHADQFARDTLIPPDRYESFLHAGDFTATSVRRFAQALEVAPAVVVGRLQHDGHLMRSQLNALKKTVRWVPPPD